MNIGFLGLKGSYSNEAALKYKGEEDIILRYGDALKAIKALESNKIQKCIVPLENTAYGGIADTMDIILEYTDINIIDEVVVDINHTLMSKSKDSVIAKIYSQPQVLSQCRRFLSQNYSEAEQIPVSSTAYAASLAAKESDTACICNMACKNMYGLEVVADSIQDIKKNQTKFVVLSKQKNTRQTKKTSIIFSTKDEPGALYKILGLFSMAEINLTKIESRPAKTKIGEYIFFVDVAGDEKDAKIKDTFDTIRKFCEEFRVLGSY